MTESTAPGHLGVGGPPTTPDPLSTFGGVLTEHNDAARTGSLSQVGLNPAVVGGPTWGLLQQLPVDAAVYAQPLFVPDVRLPGGAIRHVLVVATANNGVFGFDGTSYGVLWRRHLGSPDGTDPSLSSMGGGGCLHLAPGNAMANPVQFFMGVLSTPVVDYSTSRLYVSYRLAGISFTHAQQRLAALDVATGATLADVRTGDVPGFAIEQQRQRASLLLDDGLVFVAFGSRCEEIGAWRYHGWLFVHDAATLRQVGVYNSTPSRSGGGIWQASGGLAADERHRVYFMTGNLTGGAEPDPSGQNLGNSVVRLDVTVERATDGSVQQAGLAVGSWFTPYRARWQNEIDLDLGSAGPVLIPGTGHLAGGGKEGIIYLLDREALGGFQVAPPEALPPKCSGAPAPGYCDAFIPNNHAFDRALAELRIGVNQDDPFPTMNDWLPWPHIHGSPVYADLGDGRRLLYVWPEKDFLRAVHVDGVGFGQVVNGPDRAPAGMPGGFLSAVVDPSLPGAGVLFASVPLAPGEVEPGVLRAYDAATLRRLWTAPEPHLFAKFVPPTIADGRVFLATFSNQILVYGRRDAWRGPVGFDPADMLPGAHLTSLVRQTPSILAGLTVDTNGRANVIWLDQGLEPQRWQAAAFDPPIFNKGARPTDLARQTDTILAALAVDASGRPNVIWLDQGLEPQRWQVATFGGPEFQPASEVTNLVRQTDTILSALAVGDDGAARVIWLDQDLEPQRWQVAAFGRPDLPPGTRVTDLVRQTDTILAALVVGDDGRARVIWLDQSAEPQRWQVGAFGPPDIPPGAAVTSLVRQTDTILTALVVGMDGRPRVIWLDQGVEPQQWQVAAFGSPDLARGVGMTNLVRQTDTILTALAVGRDGRMRVLWLDQGLEPQQWRMAAFDPPSFPLASVPTNLARQSDTVLAALAVDRGGRSNVVWLDQGGDPQEWRVAPFGPSYLPRGAPITDLVRQTDTILAALTIARDSRASVIWLDQG